MPIYSMTGYASSCYDTISTHDKSSPPVTIHLEIRSINSRFLDLHFRLSEEVRSIEPQLRALISSQIKRGKVEVRLSTTQGQDNLAPQISTQALQELSRYSDIVRNWLPDVRPLSISDVLRLSQIQIRLDNIQNDILKQAKQTLGELLQSRQREGEKLAQSIQTRVQTLRNLVAQGQPLVPQIVKMQQQKFLERWQQIMEQTEPPLSLETSQHIEERALAEAATFALRIDVAEELTRLSTHLDEIQRLLQQGGEAGKRLDFIIQELHREANTLGSKSATIELTKIAVDMKVLIEQMREQVQNLE